jgi:hypothetical protein
MPPPTRWFIGIPPAFSVFDLFRFLRILKSDPIEFGNGINCFSSPKITKECGLKSYPGWRRRPGCAQCKRELNNIYDDPNVANIQGALFAMLEQRLKDIQPYGTQVGLA